MALPPQNPSPQLEKRQSASRSAVPEISGDGEKGEEDDARPMSSFLPQVNVKNGALRDLMSVHVWRNRVLWRAGVSVPKGERVSTLTTTSLLQIIEGIASGSLNFVSGLLFATLFNWPRAAVPVGVLFGNVILVSTLVSATGSSTGAHINPIVTIATTLSGHCHPVRAVIYVFCQLVGGVLGGAILRAALGDKFAYQIHNAGCWIDPEGEVGVWQAALIEFVSTFILLSVLFLLFVPTKPLMPSPPDYWPTEWDWIPVRQSCSARNMDQCLWEWLSALCKLRSLPIVPSSYTQEVGDNLLPTTFIDPSRLLIVGLRSQQSYIQVIPGPPCSPGGALDWPLALVNSRHHIGLVLHISRRLLSRDSNVLLWGQVWWIPDILAAVLHGVLYKTIPPYLKPYSSELGAEIGDV